jgi:hypothetical protein
MADTMPEGTLVQGPQQIITFPVRHDQVEINSLSVVVGRNMRIWVITPAPLVNGIIHGHLH